MRVFVCTDHDNHFVGVASVVIANSHEQARDLLDVELVKHGLRPYSAVPYVFVSFPLDEPLAMVLQDGDY